MLFGIPDPQIWIGYLLSIGFALACVVYALLNWYKGDDSSAS